MPRCAFKTPDHRLIHVIQRAATKPPVGISTEARSRGRGAVTSFIPTRLAISYLLPRTSWVRTYHAKRLLRFARFPRTALLPSSE